MLDAQANLRIYWDILRHFKLARRRSGSEEVEDMSYQMFTDGLMIGFLAGIIFCMTMYCFVLQRRGRSTKREIDVLVQQFQDHFRNTRRGNGEKME